MSQKADQEKILTLVCPDWRELERPLRIPDPFVLWLVGDQPILYHWFDHALDRGFKQVRILVADRPHRVREAVNMATLWPIILEVITVSRTSSGDGVLIDSMPGGGEETQLADEWALLAHWRKLDKAWLAEMESANLEINLSIGRLCRIHPTAKLIPPFFIGDHVAVGPGASIGPNAVIGTGSLVAENTIVREARVMPNSFLGAHLTLENSILFGGVIFNCKNKARVERIESFVADSTLPEKVNVGFKERMVAFFWWFRFRSKLFVGAPITTESKSLDGHQYPGPAHTPLWLQRMPHLWAAACGRMRLYGPLPRSDEQLEALPTDWQSILRDAIPGAIAYSDCLGIHGADDPTEALHAVYQVTHPEQTRPQCQNFLRQLTHHERPQ